MKTIRKLWISGLLALSVAAVFTFVAWGTQKNISAVIINPYENIDWDRVNVYKSNLHTHTTESDGHLSVAETVSRYSDKNYTILALADHDTCGPGANWGSPKPETTWPWTDWISEEPSVICTDSGMQTSAYYSDLGPDGVGMLAVRGNEISGCHHIGSFFNDLGYSFDPGEPRALDDIAERGGLAIIFHPGRYSFEPSRYNHLIDLNRESTIGIEVYNQGDRYPKDRQLWDSVNRLRDPDDLVWGFSFDDMHTSGHLFRNYNHHFMYDLSEGELRRALSEGTSTFSYEPGGSGDALTPKLKSIDVEGSKITLEGINYTRIIWYDENTDIITGDSTSNNNKTIDVLNIKSNFVRAVLENEYGRTYTQPFGCALNKPREE
jgi:hypothetical protein